MTTSLVSTLRANAQARIAENPTLIYIHRVEYAVNGRGGRAKSESDLPPQTVRLFLGGVPGGGVNRESTEAGQRIVADTWLLARHDADIRSGSDVEDTFAVPGRGKFRVKQVVPISAAGDVVSLQAQLEEVK